MAQKRTLKTAIAWLKQLDSEIREYQPPRSRREVGFNKSLRNVTPDEWKEVSRLIIKFDLPCTLLPGPYGFWLAVMGPGVVQNVQPEPLLYIENMQFPFTAAPKGFAGQEEVLHELEPLTHRERNQQLLAWCGFEPLRNAASYAY